MTLRTSLAPVVLFTYKRPDHTRRTLSALAANDLAAETELIVYSDAARRDADRASVDSVRSMARNIGGFASVRVVEREINLGLARSVIAGVSETLSSRSQIIVMEDDLVTSRYFLRYMNDNLKMYSDESQVASIHGYCPPIKADLPSSFFLLGADCWGWGTWKRAWQHFEPDSKKLLTELIARKLARKFDLDGAYPYTTMLRDHIAGKNDSWAIRWHASAFLKNMLTLYPGHSLVQNIGIDNTGTHCGTDSSVSPPVTDISVNCSRIETIENELARSEIANYWKRRKHSSIPTRVYSALKRLSSSRLRQF